MQKHSFGQYEPNFSEGKRSDQTRARRWEQPSRRRETVLAAAQAKINAYAVLAAVVLLALSLIILQATGARAQGQGVLSPGDAVVTGFSGIKAPDAPVAPGADPLDVFHIDLDGPSAQIFQLGATGAPAQGQIIHAQTPFKVRARDVGQVSAIALDDSRIPNIYIGQTSAFGVQIVGPDTNGDGRPDRLRKGQPDAQWMAGQLGTDKGGGPGSIYRIDGRSGAVSLFATIPGTSGTGLGAIVFDKASKHFFVSDLDTGLIHRLDASGAVIDSFDHGTAGRVTAGLDAIADDGSRIEIKDASFDVEDPKTWGFTQTERRVRGLAMLLGRLYYTVADEVWSIGIAADGRFAGDARLELQVADALPGNTIAKIIFDGEGRMYLAQRGEARGSYDYSVFAEPLQSSVLRYRRAEPADAISPADWVPVAEQYAIGFPPDYRNASGGIALGYGYDETGSMRRGACNRTLWSTGDNLRNSQAHADKLGDEGPLDVHGLQGNDVSLVRPQNEPPFKSYFVDYDGQFGDAEKAGHVGDVEIWQPCHSSYGFGQLTPGYWQFGDWPDYWTPPSGDEPTNLRLEKKAIACWKIGGGQHRCGFSIKVTNTGPGVYHDHIQVRDTIPAGTTAIFSSPKFDACPGGPPDHTCTTLAPVHLLPWEKVTIPVRVDVPDNLAKQLDCKVRNRARILYAASPSDQNTDPTDDDDAATANLPAELCKEPPKDKTNLRITKTALSCFKIAGNKIRCGYHVRVWNMGPGVYNDKITVNESVPAGATPIFSGPPALGWNCVGGNPYACTSNPVVLNPGQNALLVVRLDVTQAQAKQNNCKLKNIAKITHAPGGSDQNTNPADDDATATGNIPADLCDPPAKTNLKITKHPLSCFKIAGNKIRCGYHVRVWNTGPGVYNDHIKFTDQVPPGTTAIFSSAKFNACPGGPPTYTCTTLAPVVLNPGQNVLVVVRVDMPVNTAKQMGCKVPNRAKITYAPVGNKNTNGADDLASVQAVVPAEICDAPQLTNLKITKVANPQMCSKIVQGWECIYDIMLQNTGPGVYNDTIKLKETLPAEPLNASWNGLWNCVGGGGGGAATCTHPNVVIPFPGQLLLKLKVSFSDADVIKLKCRLPNIVEIAHVAGGNTENTNPADDKAGAVAFVPQEFCDGATNLALDKGGYGGGQSPDCPLAGNATWCKRFRIAVWNTGPGNFNGQIKVLEMPPLGVNVSFDAQAPWTCNAASKICQTNGNVALKANDPSDILVFQARLSGDDNAARALNCKVNNWARIISPLGAPINTQAADDQGHFAYDLPASLCQQPKNLQISKFATQGACNVVGSNWRCTYAVMVKNMGPGTHTGSITVQDWLPTHPAGASMTFGPGWNCNGAGSDYTCTMAFANLTPGQQVMLPVTALIPAGHWQCKLQNMARIKVPLGAPWNTNAADDLASATEDFAPMLAGGQTYCYTQEPQQCPPGFGWTGDRCARGPGLVTPTPPGCPDGQWLNKGHCCPVGQVWTGRRCGKPVKPVCPEDTVGTWPNCREVEEPKKCPEGLVGKWPDCRKVEEPKKCPDGTVGKWPNCRKVEEPKKCPDGTTGKWPNCRKVEEPKKCPEGTIGKWPNCKRPDPPKCPKGMTGTPPNCKRVVPEKCPTGTVGKPPNCRKVAVTVPPTPKRLTNQKSPATQVPR